MIGNEQFNCAIYAQCQWNVDLRVAKTWIPTAGKGELVLLQSVIIRIQIFNTALIVLAVSVLTLAAARELD